MKGQKKKLQIAFVWHMHQPDYREAGSKSLVLPWVRLHALKDYFDMPARLEAFPDVRQTFNLVPSLVEQVECYLEEGGSDRELDLFRVPADELDSEAKRTILESFFMAPFETMIRPHPRYAQLFEDYRSIDPGQIVHRWGASDWRDLQFWRQLVWIDPLIRDRDDEIAALLDQGTHFREDQKGPFLDRMNFWLRESLEIYRRMQDSGRIEVSVTPYYHPILPLLIDPASTHEAMPDAPLHPNHQSHPEDARAQMEKAFRFYEERFGGKPRGVWPSEGSVSQPVAELFAELGVEWFASDEAILARSIGAGLAAGSAKTKGDRHLLYRPYRVNSGKGPAMVFRDHALSDLIGFDYHQNWDPQAAARDFISKLHGVRDGWEGEEPPLVTVILDGENCWEHYPNDGDEFLTALYTAIQSDPTLEAVTVSEALEGRNPAPIERLAAGSWINGNFHIWIGEESDRKAWSLLENARTALVGAEAAGGVAPDVSRQAWEEIYIAEGSDWFWWFGDTHSTEQIDHFDRMFRQHLIRVYELLGQRAPGELLVPIESAQPRAFHRFESSFPSPPIVDGRESHYYEWKAAIEFEPAGQSGAMKTAEQSGIRKIYYGGDREAFFLRADLHAGRSREGGETTWEIALTQPHPLQIRFVSDGDRYRIEKRVEDSGKGTKDEGWTALEEGEAQAAGKKLFEAAVPWSILEADDSESISFYLARTNDRGESEVIPSLSTLNLKRPGRSGSTRPWFP